MANAKLYVVESFEKPVMNCRTCAHYEAKPFSLFQSAPYCHLHTVWCQAVDVLPPDCGWQKRPPQRSVRQRLYDFFWRLDA